MFDTSTVSKYVAGGHLFSVETSRVAVVVNKDVRRPILSLGLHTYFSVRGVLCSQTKPTNTRNHRDFASH